MLTIRVLSWQVCACLRQVELVVIRCAFVHHPGHYQRHCRSFVAGLVLY